jgi:hypothetical protein
MKRLILLAVTVVVGALLQVAPASAATLGLQVNDLPSSVVVGKALYVTGTAPAGRVARLQTLRGSSWLTISGDSGKGAAFSFRAPTSYYGIRTLRVISPPSGLLGEIDSAAQTVRVNPEYNPVGLPSQYSASTDYRWNPCKVINYRVNAGGLATSPMKLIRTALAKIRRATGLRFHYAGTTSVVPFSGAWNNSVPAYNLYLGWSTARKVPLLSGGVVGLGGFGTLVSTAAGSHVTQSGGAVFAKGSWPKLVHGWKKGASQGALLLHEIGHAIGLNHIGSKPEVMYPTLGTWTYPRYGAGDLKGLQKLGLDQGCLP